MTAARWLVLAAAVGFVASLFLPAIEGSGFPAFSGFDVLRQGASGWRSGVFAWYANPLLVIALAASFGRYFRFALGAAVLATVLALSSYTAGAAAELAGRSVPPFHYAAGFYVWLAGFLLAIASAVVGIYKVSGAMRSR